MQSTMKRLSPADMSSNALFEMMAKPEIATGYAELLFKNPKGPEAKVFKERLMAVSGAFLAAREALDGLLEESLAMLMRLQLPGHEAFDRAHPAVRRGLGHLIAQLEQPTSLVLAICLPGQWAGRDRLAAKLKAEFPESALDLERRWNTFPYEDANVRVEVMLLKYPKDMGSLMQAAGHALRSISSATTSLACPDGVSKPKLLSNLGTSELAEPGTYPLNRPKFGREFRFGLSRGPTLSASDTDDFLRGVESSFLQIGEGGAFGLEQGRLSEGLESLTNQYLRDFAACRDPRRVAADSPLRMMQNNREELAGECNRKEWDRLRERLSNSLVHFAEKILFVVNNEILFSSSSTADGGGGAHPANVYSGEGTNTAIATNTNVIPSDLQRPYTLVLQAVGNSILNQIDELKFRRASERRLKRRTEAELETLKRAVSQPAKTIVEDLVAGLRSAAEAAETGETKMSYENTVIVLEKKKQTILGALPDGERVDPGVVFAKVNAVLQMDTDAASCDKSPPPTPRPQVCDAIRVMKDRRAPIGSERVYTATKRKGEDARDVLDRLITALQYQRIQAIQVDPKGVKGITDAIQAAYEYRSGMAYLRPAGAYLRNSYPATGLQSDPGLRWSNMLLEESGRSIPFIGGWLSNRDSQDLKIQSQIDKQFWQTINSVRVAGGGITNYVIAKDDIGNWYVKAYSADPTPIIEAAQKLAMFGLGVQPAGALGQVPKSQTAPATAPGAATGEGTTSPYAQAQTSDQKTVAKPPTSPLQQLFDLHRSKYETQTQMDYSRLQKDLAPDQITTGIHNAWTNDSRLAGALGVLRVDLAAAAVQLTRDWAAFTDSKKPDEQASRILDGLNSILLFYRALTKKIAADVSDAAQQKAAQGALDQVVSQILNRMIAIRQATVKDYGTAITFIGEVISIK
jgi:hypothetical protein